MRIYFVDRGRYPHQSERWSRARACQEGMRGGLGGNAPDLTMQVLPLYWQAAHAMTLRRRSVPMSDVEPEICNCAALRQATRHVTKLYDDALAPLGLGVNQFSILAR